MPKKTFDLLSFSLGLWSLEIFFDTMIDLGQIVIVSPFTSFFLLLGSLRNSAIGKRELTNL